MPTTAQSLAKFDSGIGIARVTKSAIKNLIQALNLGSSSELTIASGAVTLTGKYHTVDTESDAATDNLDTISGGSAGDFLIITPANTARTVVLTNGVGNVVCPGGAVSLDATNKYALLFFDGTNWLVIADNAGLSEYTGGELTIASGAITVTSKFHTVDTESDAASDDLDTINGGVVGQKVILRVEDGARTVVVKNGTGNIACGADISLDIANNLVELVYDGTNWVLVTENTTAIAA